MKIKPFGKRSYKNIFYGNPVDSTSTIFYLKHLKPKDIKPLTREEEEALLYEYHRCKSICNSIDYDIRNRIVMANIKCVFSIVKRFEIYNATDYDYALEEGIRGLIEAVDSYDISNLGKVRFYTYASYIIHRYITLYVMKDRHIITLHEKTEQNNANLAKRLQQLETRLLSDTITNEEFIEIIEIIDTIKSKGNIDKTNNNMVSIDELTERENARNQYNEYNNDEDINHVGNKEVSIFDIKPIMEGYVIDVDRKKLLTRCANYESKILRTMLYDGVSIETIAMLAYNKIIFKILNGVNIVLFLKEQDQDVINKFMDIYNNIKADNSAIDGLRTYHISRKLSDTTKNHIKKYIELLDNIKEYDALLYERLNM